MSDTANNNEAKAINPAPAGALKLIFITLFIDLVGFSIIFPLFPGMLEYYRSVEGESGLFGLFYHALLRFSEMAGTPADGWGIIVLFGGVLGSLYSFVQFLFAPVFGALSDRVGRKPVLVVCLTGIFVSYVLWVVAGSFAILVLARLLGGVMSANISTATAVVADVTDVKTRSRGMAIIGIAFGLGFIVGPVLGGFSAAFDPTAVWPALARYGINPYSAPAAVAALLTLCNLVLVICFLPETRRKGAAVKRTANPLVLLSTKAFPGVFQTNLANLFFIFAFAGMEFSLTFLAVERLGFDAKQNAYMFVFVGVVMALVQGGYVRRQAEVVGPKRMMLRGLLLLIPALTLVGLAGQYQSVGLLYAGLFLLAIGSGMVTPCLTTLVSVYAPPSEQGRVMGIFRSLGALGRAVGPIVACILYWRLGAAPAYYIGAASIIIPFMIGLRLPEPPSGAQGPL